MATACKAPVERLICAFLLSGGETRKALPSTAFCEMALPGCEYSCAACFCSKSVSRAVVLLIASESVNFHTVVKEIPIREDFA